MTTFSKDTLYKNTDYAPFDRTAYTAGAKAGQRFAIYYPTGSPSDYAGVTGVNRDHPGAWAYMLYTVDSSGTTSTPDYADGTATTISETTGATGGVGGIALNTGGIIYQCLLNGIAVVCAQVTAICTANSGGSVPNGFGMLHTPGGTSGFYESLDFPTAVKDTVLLAQHFQRNASRYSFHPNSWGVIGTSFAANIWAHIALAPSRAYELGTWGPYVFNTVPNVAVLSNLVAMHWKYYDQSISIPNWPSSETSSTTFAGTVGAAPPRYLRECSADHFISDPGEDCIAPTWYFSDTAGVSARIGMPYLEGSTDTAGHSAWNGFALRQYVKRGRVFLATGSTGRIASSGSINMAEAADSTAFSGDTSIDAEGVADTAISSDASQAIRHIVGHINTPRWDSVVPPIGIARRGQVNSTGRFCVPPAGDGRAGVEVVNSGGEGFAPLQVGTDPYNVLRALPTGLGDASRMVLYTTGPVYLRAYGGALAVAQYRTRELSALFVRS